MYILYIKVIYMCLNINTYIHDVYIYIYKSVTVSYLLLIYIYIYR